MKGRALFAVAIAVLAAALVGCGGGKDSKKEALLEDSRAQPKALPMSVQGTSKEVDVSVPESVPVGPARIDFGNNAQGEHQLQFVRLDEGHKPEEGLKAATDWASKGKPLPDWVHPAGGTPITEPRAKSSTTQDIQAGVYFVMDTALDGPPQVEATFVASGDREHSDPTAKAKIVAYEYGFKASGIDSGRTEVLIQNTGEQPHFVEAIPIKDGKTIDDVKDYLKTQAGESPLDDKDVEASAVQEADSAQVTTLEFQKGSYALLCFVPDRAGGPPHAFKGMVSELQVVR
jgi:hypothetical protein